MKLDRLKAPALAATAVLLISGAASAFAASPAPVTPAAPVAPVVQAKSAGPDTDTLQVGDQTTPDVAAPAAVSAAVLAAAPTTQAAPAEAKGAAEAKDAAETPEATGTETDGPGGHADAAGQNVDHQFNGEE